MVSFHVHTEEQHRDITEVVGISQVNGLLLAVWGFPSELHAMFIAERRAQSRHMNHSRRSIMKRWHTDMIQQRDTARYCAKRSRNFWATAGGSSIGP